MRSVDERINAISFTGPFIVFLVLFTLELTGILLINDGHLIFTLDDPYIHLALAENLIHGHYGVNLEELSAPSSSILWPLLLAPFTVFAFADWIVLFLNLVFASATLWIQFQIIRQVFAQSEGNSRALKITAYTCLILLIPIANSIGLIFTGMEHSLQVLLAHVVFYGLIEENTKNRLPKYLLPALIIAPLIRYESMSLTAPALLYLFFRGYRLPSIISGGLLLAVLLGFSLFLNSHDLGYIPNSILAKSAGLSEAGAEQRVAANLQRNMLNPIGWLLLLLILAYLPLLKSKAAGSMRWVFAILVCAGVLHFIFGSLWWYGRYETYIYSVLALGLLFGYRARLVGFISRRKPWFSISSITLPLVFFSIPSLFILLTTPYMANWIYVQQYQFHKYLTEYHPYPVAVNDLGWVSWKNDKYILDLWGLASKKALDCRQVKDVNCYDSLVKQYNVHLAILTDAWFPELPQTWVKIGEFECGYPFINAVNGVCNVGFYATDRQYAKELQASIEKFSLNLPKPAQLKLIATDTTHELTMGRQ